MVSSLKAAANSGRQDIEINLDDYMGEIYPSEYSDESEDTTEAVDKNVETAKKSLDKFTLPDEIPEEDTGERISDKMAETEAGKAYLVAVKERNPNVDPRKSFNEIVNRYLGANGGDTTGMEHHLSQINKLDKNIQETMTLMDSETDPEKKTSLDASLKNYLVMSEAYKTFGHNPEPDDIEAIKKVFEDR